MKSMVPHLARGIRYLAALVAVAACSDLPGPSEVGPITELPRELSVAEREVVSASNGFGLELVRRVAASDARPNVVLSPLSASMALGMTLNGADTGTFDAMSAALGFEGLTQAQINDSYRDLIDLLTDLDPEVRFEIANAIWANEDVSFHEAFFEAVAAAFDAVVESRDFEDAATLQDINEWVRENTDGLIDSILDELPPSLVMLLVNAIYLDAAWTFQFDPEDTSPAPFTREDGSTVPVELMRLTDAEIGQVRTDEFSAVELPYGGEAFSMVLLLPSEGMTVREVLAGLDVPAWDALTDGLEHRSGIGLVALPKFTVTYDGLLNDALMDMGMGVAFGPGADFTRMSPMGDMLCISFVRQKAFIEVDERGTRAAAVTAVGIGVTSAPPAFIADRPFLFAIRERLSGTILFAGLVGDPSAESPPPPPTSSECA